MAQDDNGINGHVPVPTWTMVITYVLCWALGAILLLTTIFDFADIHNRGLLLGVGVYLIFWPVLQQNPKELFRAIWPTQ